MTLEEYQAAQAAKKQQRAQQKSQPQDATLEQNQAARREQEAAQRAAAAPPASKAAADEEPTKAAEPPAEAPKEAEPPAEAAGEAVVEDDWEASAAAADESVPAQAEEPAEEVTEAPAVAAAPKEEEKEAAQEEQTPADEAEELAAEEETAADDDNRRKILAEPDPRMHLNVVFIGHVDAGKSTTCGNILYLSNCVDERTIEKYQKEAKDKNRESWFLAYIMDTNEEEKAKGKTVEVGRAHFETEHRRFTILDAPGHKSYVPNMISGASQADIGVLIISARKGEFETGFERGGQTREHALLAKTLGVEKLMITVNKMDDQSVEWKQARYDEIVKKLAPFLKQSGFKDDQVVFLPISGLTGDNVNERKSTPSWFTGTPLLETLDKLEMTRGNKDAAFRIPMLDGYRDMGATMAIGKIEQGTVRPGQKAIVMPIGKKCTIVSVFINDVEMAYASVGENVTMKMAGIGDDDLTKGFVLCPLADPIRVVTKFKAQLQIIELPEERPVMTAGYRAVMHVHVANEECEILKLYESCSLADRKKKEKNPRFVRENSVVTCSLSLARPTALDAFTGTQQLGRFTLRDEGRTIAIGKITELPKEEAADGKRSK